jgi:hypothetical protein
MPDRQLLLFTEAENIRHQTRCLSKNQRKIIALVACQLNQSQIADRLSVSRPYVNQVVKRLESWNLIKRIPNGKTRDGIRSYTYYYEVCPEVLVGQQPFTPYRVHNIRRKFKILKQSGDIVKDKRAAWTKSWPMRGGERHKFWFPGRAGMPSVTVDWHPGTLVCYIDKGSQIAASSMEEAERIAEQATFQARDQFIELQASFGIAIETDRVGAGVGKPHAGLVMRDDGPFRKADPVTPGLWVDRSVESELGPGHWELEGHTDHPLLTDAEECLIAARDLKTKMPEMIKAAMPEAMKDLEKIGPLTSEVLSVLAHIQSGEGIQNQVNQLIMMFGKMLEQQHEILKRMNYQQ